MRVVDQPRVSDAWQPLTNTTLALAPLDFEVLAGLRSTRAAREEKERSLRVEQERAQQEKRERQQRALELLQRQVEAMNKDPEAERKGAFLSPARATPSLKRRQLSRRPILRTVIASG